MFTSPKRCALLSASLLATGILAGFTVAATSSAQTTPSAATTPAAANNLVGTVTTTGADALTIKLENGSEATIAIGPQTRLLRTAPGEKTLKGATVIHVEDLTAGDRVLVLRPALGSEAGHYTAAAIVTMKQADIAQVHATEAADWQRRGVGGIVKTIQTDPALTAAASPSGGGPGATIVLSTPQPDRTLAIHLTPATVIRRYAPDSVNFADAKQATLADIHPGDQLRARGDKNEDGTQVTAVEIVAGSFRNVAGTITTIDTAQNTLTVTDLATKKPVTLKLNTETQMRKLPAEMAQRLAQTKCITHRLQHASQQRRASPQRAGRVCRPRPQPRRHCRHAPARPSCHPGRAQKRRRSDGRRREGRRWRLGRSNRHHLDRRRRATA